MSLFKTIGKSVEWRALPLSAPQEDSGGARDLFRRLSSLRTAFVCYKDFVANCGADSRSVSTALEPIETPHR